MEMFMMCETTIYGNGPVKRMPFHAFIGFGPTDNLIGAFQYVFF